VRWPPAAAGPGLGGALATPGLHDGLPFASRRPVYRWLQSARRRSAFGPAAVLEDGSGGRSEAIATLAKHCYGKSHSQQDRDHGWHLRQLPFSHAGEGRTGAKRKGVPSTTEQSLKAMDGAGAIIGLSSQPVEGKRTPAASGECRRCCRRRREEVLADVRHRRGG